MRPAATWSHQYRSDRLAGDCPLYLSATDNQDIFLLDLPGNNQRASALDGGVFGRHDGREEDEVGCWGFLSMLGIH